MTRLLAVLVALVAIAGCTSGPRDPGRVAIVGDSLTTGAGVAQRQSYASLMEAAEPGDQVLPIARDGATARRWIVWHADLVHQLRTWRPDTVVVTLGGNEFYLGRPPTMYGEQLVDLAGIIRGATPDARLIFVHPYEIRVRNFAACDIGRCLTVGQVAHSGGKPAGSLGGPPVESGVAAPWRDYGAAMAAAAADSGPFYAGQPAPGYVDLSGAAPWREHLLGDRIHLTAEGHRLYAAALAEAIGAPS